jgi:LacI family transcriptional regulator
MANKRATIIDVARLAGVSWKTVSRVVNQEPNVSDKVRGKVQHAIAQLDYVPHNGARALAGVRSYSIGILFDNPSPHYTMKIQAGAYAGCRAYGYHLLIENLESAHGDIAGQMKRVLQNTKVDGFILTPPLTESAIVMDALEAQQIPFVRIAPVSFAGRSSAISINDAAAAAEIARHFWGLGHRRFGLVNGPADHGAASTRRDGFLTALSELGSVSPVAESYGGFFFDTGITAGRDLLQLTEPPTAIFAMNDDSAAGVMAAAAQLDLKVPDDVAVAGFDDSWIAQSVWPNLTTVYQPISEMAQAAAELLITKSAAAPAAELLLDYRVVLRNSTLRVTL